MKLSPQRPPAIRELPPSERPRERLLHNGSGSLADSELLAVLLRTGRRGVSVLDQARELLERFDGLSGLLGAGRHGLARAGLGPVKVATLLAALEMARRLARSRLPDRMPLSRPEAVAAYLGLRYGARGQEIMGALYLDTRNRLIGEGELFRGTLNRAAVEPRAILKGALLRDAAGFVLFHTHPSGDPSPSAEDIAFTRRLAESGELVGIRLVDHLIVGAADRWVSLKQRGVC